MKITDITIKNFKAIKKVSLTSLDNTVLIAGPNGCGKSCVFHAIRLLKSIIGGYQPNEWHQWFNEFQIRPQHVGTDILKLFQSRKKSLEINANFELSKHEQGFLKSEGPEMIVHNIWSRHVPQLKSYHYKSRIIPAEFKQLETLVEQESKPIIAKFKKELELPTQRAKLVANTNGILKVDSTLPLQIAFSIFESENIGVIDYHGPHRDYKREQIGNINLNIQTSKENLKNHSLYNYSNKYNNVKQEMAGDYIKYLLMEKSGTDASDLRKNLINTLQELFLEFFPGKEFLGPVPNSEGGLDFPVKLSNGTEHDINDLSSGEKEVLYGYLRLRHSAPQDSIILLDEPELHLNPRLIRGLPKFYKKNLGEDLGNQLWLVTHSDEFLRHAVGEHGLAVYHMQMPAKTAINENQVKPVDAEDVLNKAVIDLVGDLASYGPNKKVVVFEGENSDFDINMTLRLFPSFQDDVNPISAGSKNRVTQLHELLEKATESGEIDVNFYSIVDRDLGHDEKSVSDKAFTWNVYHIENYLLNEYYISESISELTLGDVILSQERVLELLKECAQESVNQLVGQELRRFVNSEILSNLKYGYDPSAQSIAPELFHAIEMSLDRIDEKTKNNISLISIEEREIIERNRFNNSISEDTWKEEIKGRDILRRFVGKIGTKFSYETLRNTIISRMASDNYKPPGMEEVINQILSN